MRNNENCRIYVFHFVWIYVIVSRGLNYVNTFVYLSEKEFMKYDRGDGPWIIKYVKKK